MKNKSIPELDKLFIEIGTYRKSEDLMSLFEFIKKFSHIAPYNAMLLHVQKPGSQYVASASEWRKKFQRTVKPGSNPLVILRAFGPVEFVFELGDTNAIGKEELPKSLINPFKVEGEILKAAFNKFIDNLKTDGILYAQSNHGTGSAGYIKKSNGESVQEITTKKKTTFVKVLFELVVNGNHSNEIKFATIAHELGHLYCGHLGIANVKWLDDRWGLSKNEREFEAECVCWLVCERKGLENPSASYLNGYLDGNKDIPNISIDAVLKAVGIIESMLNTKKYPRKELVEEVND